MELLVVTLAYIQPGRDADAQAVIRQITDNMRSAIGIIGTRAYRGREGGLHYLLLTTWEDEESWQKAQDRYDPCINLLNSPDLLLSAPEQWLMYYQWGYSRPARPINISTVHIATLQFQQVDVIQQAWISTLQQESQAPTLAFAFVARGMDREGTAPRPVVRPGQFRQSREHIYQQGPILLIFLNWASESEREEFHASATYRTLQKKAEAAGIIRILALDQL